MEIVCIDKKAFDEMCNHFSEFEDRVNRLCATRKDLALKNWMVRMYARYSEYQNAHYKYIARRD